MKTPKLKPLLFKETCEQHGLTNFIVDQQEFNFKSKEVTFVFYCKKCWQLYAEDCPAFKTTILISEYNNYFGFDDRNEN